MVHATQVLTYSKGHVYYILLTYSMTLLFWNLLHPLCDENDLIYNIILTPNPKSENKKINRK